MHQGTWHCAARCTLAWLLAACATLAAAAPTSTAIAVEPSPPARDGSGDDELTYFDSREAFSTWVRDWRRTLRAGYGTLGTPAPWTLVAAIDDATSSVTAPCTDPAGCPDATSCADPTGDPSCTSATRAPEEMVLTAQRTTASSVTSNQSAGVDEGDVVKLIGRHLVVLHEGRLFVVDIGPAGTPRKQAGTPRKQAGTPRTQAGTATAPPAMLRLVDRTNLYRDPNDDAWYDEMVVHGRHVFVSRYSYDDSESSIDVLTLGRNGTLRREARYRIRSFDYYSGSNYALRLVGDQLLLYVPVPLYEFHRGREDEVQLPELRVEARGRGTRTLPVLPATRILKPSLYDAWLSLHVLVTCDISALPEIDCRAEGVVGPESRELYVTAGHAYLWLTAEPRQQFRWNAPCPAGVAPTALQDPARVSGAVAYRFDLHGAGRRAGTKAARAYGMPVNQFALRETADGLHALLAWPSSTCGPWREVAGETAPRLAHIPESGFSTTLSAARMASFRILPGNEDVEVQLTDTLAVYANTQEPDYRGRVPAEPRRVTATVRAVPFDPDIAITTLPLDHGVDRIELVGHGAVAVGRPGELGGLGISAIDLRGTPAVSTTHADTSRAEAETRSHAFNALVDANGEGLFALPTMRSSTDWRLPADTDLRFFQLDARHRFQPAGALASAERPPELKCEVSCIDWYGNARAVFIGQRVFALVGYELLEGTLEDGRIVEHQRLRLDAAPDG